MDTPTLFVDTMPAPRADTYIPITAAENAAYNAGRRHQEPISVLEGARMAKLLWFCTGVMAGVALLGSLQSCGG